MNASAYLPWVPSVTAFLADPGAEGQRYGRHFVEWGWMRPGTGGHELLLWLARALVHMPQDAAALDRFAVGFTLALCFHGI